MRKLSASLLLGFLFLELMLRIIPLKYTDFNSTFQFVGDAEVGYLPVPNQDATNNFDCFQVPHIRTNSLGLRGAEWSTKGRPKVALLGDSFLLALQVSDQYHMAQLLESATGGEVLNAGVSGYGTYQELLIWRKFLRARRPEVTVLMLYLENDIRDNHCGLCRAENQHYCPCLTLQHGQVVEQMDFELRKPLTGFRAWFKENCYTYRLLRNLTKPNSPSQSSENMWAQESFAYNIYRPGLSQQWDEGWALTAWSLRVLQQECNQAGSKLLVVNVPSIIQVATDLHAELKAQLGSEAMPADVQLDFPMQRLTAFADSEGIALLDLQPAFLAYRDRHQLPNPVFGWCCDGHWNPLGHRLAADLMYNDLLQRGWVKGPKRETPAPVEVLGQEMMAKIYSCETMRFE